MYAGVPGLWLPPQASWICSPPPPPLSIHVWLSASRQHPVICITCPGLPWDVQAFQEQHPQADIESGSSPEPAGDVPPSMSLFPCLHTFPGLNFRMSAFLPPSAFKCAGAVFTTKISISQRCKGGSHSGRGDLRGTAFQRRKRTSVPPPVQRTLPELALPTASNVGFLPCIPCSNDRRCQH